MASEKIFKSQPLRGNESCVEILGSKLGMQELQFLTTLGQRANPVTQAPGPRLLPASRAGLELLPCH